MRTHEVITSFVWVIIGVIICIASAFLKLGSWRNPEPGLFPFLIGCGIILVSSYQVMTQLFMESGIFKFWPHSGGFKRGITIFALTIFYTITLEHLGFTFCTFVFFMALFKILGQKTWRYSILTSLIVSIFSYIFFQFLLKINLPKGFLGI